MSTGLTSISSPPKKITRRFTRHVDELEKLQKTREEQTRVVTSELGQLNKVKNKLLDEISESKQILDYLKDKIDGSQNQYKDYAQQRLGNISQEGLAVKDKIEAAEAALMIKEAKLRKREEAWVSVAEYYAVLIDDIWAEIVDLEVKDKDLNIREERVLKQLASIDRKRLTAEKMVEKAKATRRSASMRMKTAKAKFKAVYQLNQKESVKWREKAAKLDFYEKKIQAREKQLERDRTILQRREKVAEQMMGRAKNKYREAVALKKESLV